MNRYQLQFFAKCPVNGVRVTYDWTVETFAGAMLPVEALLDAAPTEGFHEAIADALFAKFGGKQTLVAFHHGVTITTVRGGR